MIPWVSGKCILSAFTSRRLFPLSKVAVERLRWMKLSCCTAIPLALLLLGRVLGQLHALHLWRQVGDLRLDRLELRDAADVTPPVGRHEPAAFLGAEAAGLVVGLR